MSARDAGSPTDAQLAARFGPVFEAVAAGAVARERERVLPHDAIGLLRDAGFLAVRVPVELGGSGASVDQLFRLLIELAAADSNLPQALRAHLGFVEERLHSPASPARDRWLRAVAAGALIGNATTERGDVPVGEFLTRLDTAAQPWRITGTKHYSTGSLFADWIAVGVSTETGRSAFALVPAADPRIELVDDWNGFGQRLTASGTTVLDGVAVEPADVFWFDERPLSSMIAFYQLVLLATLAGIARAAERDAAAYVRGRTRAFSHGSAGRPADDPLVQGVVGTIAALAYTAESAVIVAVDALARLDRLADVRELTPADFDEVELTVSRAHVAIVDVVLRATTMLFDVGGASSADADRALDRHWRNARTISTHNPVVYKARIVGENLLTGARPAHAWTVGTAVVVGSAGAGPVGKTVGADAGLVDAGPVGTTDDTDEK